MRPAHPPLFITGTDTGVGKTILAALLVRHLRDRGVDAAAIKPFCSGSQSDLRRLRAAQDGRLSLKEICPFYFPEPLAPLVAARRQGKKIALDEVLALVLATARRCERLVIEGAGGLLAPLGEGYSAADLIRRLRSEVLVVAANRLGTINHTLLTMRTLGEMGVDRVRVVLSSVRRDDSSARWNLLVLRELIGHSRVWPMPWLGPGAGVISDLKKNCRKVKKVLARLAG